MSHSDYQQYGSEILAEFTRLGVVISGLSSDSRQIKPGMIFAAYPGTTGDGRDYIAAAIAAGAVAILWEAADFSWVGEWPKVPNLAVPNLQGKVGAIAAQLYGQPSQDLWTIGITGTNGKTSCSQWLAQGLNSLSRRTAVMGTLGNGFLPDLVETGNTTTDAALLQAMLASYRHAGATAVVMEVSSHGLDQGRVNGVAFDVAVLTNLSRDHLDYHGDMASYAAAKTRLFDWPGLRFAVLNLDDEFGRTLVARRWANGAQIVGYGFEQGDIRGSDLQLSGDGLQMKVSTPWGSAELTTALLGRFNAHNLLACLATLLVSEVTLDEAVHLLSTIAPVPGRMQTLGGGKMPWVVIDYAHSPDALEKVLLTLREIDPAGKLWCLFGCGGERDLGKRPLMGAIASRYADRVMVTSDNPRSEDPWTIIAAIRVAMGGNELVEVNRATAITTVIAQAEPGDVVLIAGKGHEQHQEIAGIKYPFSDLQVARRALEERLCA